MSFGLPVPSVRWAGMKRRHAAAGMAIALALAALIIARDLGLFRKLRRPSNVRQPVSEIAHRGPGA
jgi:hypothetical protein